MIVQPAVSTSATPNGTTRPQVRIVIVGHVDHGKSTLVGRLLHETGSLPEGKLEMLKAVSARRGMPFEWSFLLDALQGVRDQTRRHGYLLHLLGIKQVAVVVNKMDRVDFGAARFDEISKEISAHLTGLGVTPSAI